MTKGTRIVVGMILGAIVLGIIGLIVRPSPPQSQPTIPEISPSTVPVDGSPDVVQ